jgi:hypothetical protein
MVRTGKGAGEDTFAVGKNTQEIESIKEDGRNDIPLASGAGMMADVWSKWRVATDSSPSQGTANSTKLSTYNKGRHEITG